MNHRFLKKFHVNPDKDDAPIEEQLDRYIYKHDVTPVQFEWVNNYLWVMFEHNHPVAYKKSKSEFANTAIGFKVNYYCSACGKKIEQDAEFCPNVKCRCKFINKPSD